jgi:hypothetical protein
MSERRLKPVPTIRVNADTGEVGDTGKTLEELAEEAAADPPFMRGSTRQLSFDVGGRDDLISSRIKIPGGEFPLLGQFPQGKRIRIELDIEIEDIHFKAVRDREGLKVGRERIHKAVVIDQPKIADPKK